MFSLYANKTKLILREKELMTSGSANVYDVQFEFSDDWNGLTKTAVFKLGKNSESVLLDDDVPQCTIPTEIMVDFDRPLMIGVYGTLDETTVLPTIWANAGTVREGTELPEETPGEGGGISEEQLAELKAEIATKGDALEYDGLDLKLLSDGKEISSVPMIGGGGNLPEITGVLAFNGRQGSVKPQAGDYTAEMVGAMPDTFEESDPTVPKWAKQPEKPTYTAEEVGADPAGTAEKVKEEIEDSLASKLDKTGGVVTGAIRFESDMGIATLGLDDEGDIDPLEAPKQAVAVSSAGLHSTGDLRVQTGSGVVEFSTIGDDGEALTVLSGIEADPNDEFSVPNVQQARELVSETVSNATKQVEGKIPTKVSQLSNDQGFITGAEADAKISDAIADIEGGDGIVGPPGPAGPQGETGPAGEDGFSPTVSIAPSENDDGDTNGTVVTITDVNGEHQFTVLNGLDGKDALICVTPGTGELVTGLRWIPGTYFNRPAGFGDICLLVYTDTNTSDMYFGTGKVDALNGAIGAVQLDVQEVTKITGSDGSAADVINRCVWIYEAGDDISLFAEGNTNVASPNEFIGHTPVVSNGAVGLILVDDKLYWTKFNITAASDNAVTQEFTQDPILIGPSDGGSSVDKLITIKDTEVTNISQLPTNSCCIHAINSTIGFPFNDDICYVRIGVSDITVYTIDGHMLTLNIIPGGNLAMAEDGQDQWAKASETYTKNQIDEMFAGISAEDELLTFENKTLNNTALLPMDAFPCCLHLINSWLGASFKDDIVYAKTAGPLFWVYTMNGVIIELEINQENGQLTSRNIEYLATKGYVDGKIEDVEAGTGPEYTAGQGIEIADDTISVKTPITPVTQEEYNALTDEQKNSDVAWLLTDAESTGGGGNSSVTQEYVNNAISAALSNSRIVLTEDEYNALATKDPNVLYLVKE